MRTTIETVSHGGSGLSAGKLIKRHSIDGNQRAVIWNVEGNSGVVVRGPSTENVNHARPEKESK